MVVSNVSVCKSATLATLPTIVAFMFVQRLLTDAAITSGIKG